jgi:hypothetical protein
MHLIQRECTLTLPVRRGICLRYGCNNLLNIHARAPFILGRNDFSEIYEIPFPVRFSYSYSYSYSYSEITNKISIKIRTGKTSRAFYATLGFSNSRAWRVLRPRNLRRPWPSRFPGSVMVGMARRAVPARVVAGGTNIGATLAFEGVAPLHAARTSQRDVPTTLNTNQTGEGTARPVFRSFQSSWMRPPTEHESPSPIRLAKFPTKGRLRTLGTRST